MRCFRLLLLLLGGRVLVRVRRVMQGAAVEITFVGSGGPALRKKNQGTFFKLL